MPRMILSPAGSSPLTRGKRRRRSRRLQAARLIPAHAGKTRGAGRVAPRPSAHPRSRGENTDTPPDVVAPIGSSPLTRGKHGVLSLGSWSGRLIPAHAGKTTYYARGACNRWAHPRSRGENDPTDPSHPLATGSSPLTRGKPTAVYDHFTWHRLIPAHAGKTHRSTRFQRRRGAHPRSRGENADARE